MKNTDRAVKHPDVSSCGVKKDLFPSYISVLPLFYDLTSDAPSILQSPRIYVVRWLSRWEREVLALRKLLLEVRRLQSPPRNKCPLRLFFSAST